MEIPGHGVYSLPEAARLDSADGARGSASGFAAGVSWIPASRCSGAITSTPISGDSAISFLDLVDLFVVGQLRDHGVPLKSLRKVHAQLKKDLKTANRFCRKEVLSDGRKVFTLGLNEQKTRPR